MEGSRTLVGGSEDIASMLASIRSQVRLLHREIKHSSTAAVLLDDPEFGFQPPAQKEKDSNSANSESATSQFRLCRTLPKEKRTRLEVKIIRVAKYWSGESPFVPNVFRVTTPDSDSPDTLIEFQDFSGKEVTADEKGFFNASAN